MDKNTRIIDLTLGQFEEWLESKGFKSEVELKRPKNYVYGYAGVMELFNCSAGTASRLIKGKIKDACYQEGRKIVIDAEKAMELFNN